MKSLDIGWPLICSSVRERIRHKMEPSKVDAKCSRGHLNTTMTTAATLLRYTFSLIQGLAIFSIVLCYILLSFPIFLYRLLITRIAAPLCHPKFGKPVSPTSNAYATDLYNNQRPPRTAIIVDMILEGTIPLEEANHLINTRLINAVTENGRCRYPELRQFVEPWMGFLFWKPDSRFRVENHVKLHTLEKSGTVADSDQFVCKLIEAQLNNPFPSKKSPWEFHLVHNFRAKDTEKECTLVVLRFQHCMADGYSILRALVEGLAGVAPEKMITLEDLEAAAAQRQKGLKKAPGILQRFLHDVDYTMEVAFRRPVAPWFVPDAKKQWKQVYARADPISLDKLKAAKNRLGVSLTGLILSAVSAGISQSLKSKGVANEDIKKLQTFSTIPLPGRPKGFTNHHAGVVFDIPVQIDLKPVDRLWECENFLETAKQTLLLPLAIAVWHMMGYQLAPVNAKLFQNPRVSTFLTNFPGPSFPIVVNGRRLLSTSFAVGGGSGVCGIGFMVFTFNGTLRVVLTAENAVMTKEELQLMLDRILQEFETLYEVSLEKNIISNGNKPI